MGTLNKWREVIAYSILSESAGRWSQNDLDAALVRAHAACVRTCVADNGGYVAMTLSGGLDSTLSLAMVRREFPDARIWTFTVGSSDQHPDVRFSELAARGYGAERTLFLPDERDRQSAAEELVLLGEQPTAGNQGVLLMYRRMAELGVRCVLAHDGIDELMGGYWEHRAPKTDEERLDAFRKLWALLTANHLEPQERKADRCGITVIHPYLQDEVVRIATSIPLLDRSDRQESKKPLRLLARKLGIPNEIIERRKLGFCHALENL